ncbi:MAG: hypothetical protein MJE77_29340 [Proteobacteria bacterium]|nr:hypothetical protein [Pseudomonadota bacterium]
MPVSLDRDVRHSLTTGPIDRPTLVVGIAVSVALHALAGGLLASAAPENGPGDESEPMVLFDVDVAPPPPEAEMPPDEERQLVERAGEIEADRPDQSAEETPQPAKAETLTVDLPPPPPAQTEEEPPAEPIIADAGALPAETVVDMPDAGVDAASAVVTVEVPDASPQAMANDAASSRAADSLSDARPDSGDLADIDWLAVAELADAGIPGQPASSDSTEPSTTGFNANLLSYFPGGELVTVLIRLDRLRQPPWSRLTEAVLRPMPDYRTLIGSRDLSITQLFDTLVISSNRPRAITATTLVARTRMVGRELRAFLDHPESPVVWRTARGGPLGRTSRSRQAALAAVDPRVFLMPFPGWVLLGHPRRFGRLVEPVAGDIDMAMARTADLPQWLRQISSIERESGQDSGPALILTVAGALFPPDYRIPYLGKIDTPEQITLALELTRGGLYARGTLIFLNPARASRFVSAAGKSKREFVDTRLGKLALSRFHIYNALSGLSLKQNGRKVGFATSLSVSDSRAMLEFAARFTQDYFSRARARVQPVEQPIEQPLNRPQKGSPKSPAGPPQDRPRSDNPQ